MTGQDMPASLGERYHNPAGCHAHGSPHLGLCIDLDGIFQDGVEAGRKAAADAVWAKAKALREGYRTGQYGIEYVNGFEDAAEVANPE